MKTKLSPFLLSLLIPQLSYAGGLYLYEVGTDDVGLASAGAAARAQDSSVLANNPAGLSHVKGQSFTAGAQLLYGNADYTRELGDTAEDVIGAVPALSGFYSTTLDNNWSFGVGLYGNYGSGLDFGNTLELNENSPANAITKTTLMALTLQPTASYRFNEHWSVGASLGINYGIFNTERNNLSGQSNNSEDSDVAFNGKVGFLYELSEDTRFGIGYTSETTYDFSTDGLLDGGALQGASISTNAPQQVMLSAFHQVSADWAIMGNLGWQDWSKLLNDDIELSTGTGSSISLSNSDKVQDTYHVAIGSQYKVNDKWLWNAGFAYDSSLYKDQHDASLATPSGSTYRLGTGFKYSFGRSRSFGMAFEYVAIEDSEVRGPLAGSYDTSMYFIMMNYSWQSL